MRKNNLIIAVILAIFLTGCGKQTEPLVTDSVVEAEKNTSAENQKAETFVQENPEDVKTEDSYTEEGDVLIWNNGRNDGEQVDFSTWENINKEYALDRSINIYYTDTSLAGYTKEDATVAVVCSDGEWNFCIFGKYGYLVKVEDLLNAATAADEEETLATTIQPEVPEQQTGQASVGETVAGSAQVEASVAESDKYTPEEAIAVYRSLVEAGGMTWNPELKGVTSWGTGWIYLDKGYPEWAASSNLESFAMGDTVGNPCTEYYLEVTGSDESTVYITEWHN